MIQRLRQIGGKWLVSALSMLPALPWDWSQAVLRRFYADDVGREYGISRAQKRILIRQFQVATEHIPTATSWLYHVVLATAILQVPSSAPGIVVECGCWKGGSTASLSLVCGMTGRKLHVFDSFEGLPAENPETVHQYPGVGVYGYYQKGMYAAELEEVWESVRQYGNLAACEFVPGYFSESLKTLKESVVFAFLDVDLASSMRDCIKHIWPVLNDGGLIYTDDSCDMEVVRLWFDDQWWQANLYMRAPGYVGSGCGLPVSPAYSSLGYARKVARPEETYKRVSWLYYPDTGRMGE